MDSFESDNDNLRNLTDNGNNKLLKDSEIDGILFKIKRKF